MSYRDQLTSLFQQVLGVIGSFRLADFLDICLVAFVVYSVVKFVRETRAIQLFKGILLFGIVYAVISVLEMQASSYLFRSVASNAVVFLIIIFTPEIRHALESAMNENAQGMYAFFGNTIDPMRGKPTNAQAIGALAERLRIS